MKLENREVGVFFMRYKSIWGKNDESIVNEIFKEIILFTLKIYKLVG